MDPILAFELEKFFFFLLLPAAYHIYRKCNKTHKK